MLKEPKSRKEKSLNINTPNKKDIPLTSLDDSPGKKESRMIIRLNNAKSP